MSLEHLYILDASEILKQIGEDILNSRDVKIFDLEDKISVLDKNKFEKHKI